MTKKTLIALLPIFLVVGLACNSIVLAQVEPPELPSSCQIRADPARVKVTGCPVSEECVYGTNEYCGICCLMGTVLWITDWIFVFLMLLVMIFVLIGAFNILTAAGSADKVNTGRDYIMFAAIGLAVALLARAVPALVRYIVAPTI